MSMLSGKGLFKTYKSLAGGKQQIIEILRKEDFLNLNCLYDDFCNHSSETLTDVELCAIDKTMLEKLLKRKPRVGLILIDFMKNKLIRSYDKIRDLGQKNARSRIVSFLLDLSENLHDEPQLEFVLPLSRTELAEAVGLSEETGIRILQDLKRDKLISIDRNNVVLLNLPRLHKISER